MGILNIFVFAPFFKGFTRLTFFTTYLMFRQQIVNRHKIMRFLIPMWIITLNLFFAALLFTALRRSTKAVKGLAY
jgi:hypothetical protein